MNISISLTLDQEQTDALQERVDNYNASSGLPEITPSDFIKTVHVSPFIQSLVEQRYTASLNRLGEGFKVLPYDARLATIATLESQLP